jgi:hypothetical protein
MKSLKLAVAALLAGAVLSLPQAGFAQERTVKITASAPSASSRDRYQ